MRAWVLGVAAAAGFCATTFLASKTAEACGGCFNPPETPTVVTDHRMLFTISKQESTLYDQIRYTGSPDAFGWVLPTKGVVKVGISADVVFGAIDSITQTQILPPPRNCPARPPSCPVPESRASAGGGTSNDGVNVIKREVVGPYETVQLEATKPNALKEWLAQNKFTIPPDVVPLIDTYVAEQFNFLALKLLPGKGTQDMRPVRVTTPQANVQLPLRMIAAGTGAQVGISLWILGEGRYEPQNFPSFLLNVDEIAWDWTQNKSNYIELRAQRNAAGGGRIWEIESSMELDRGRTEGIIRQGAGGGDPQTAPDYLPDPTKQQTAVQVRDEDIGTLFSGLQTVRVTRMRADLVKAALNADLQMTASTDQALVSNVRQLTKELNQPVCPVWNGCTSNEQAPRDQAIARSNPGGSIGGGSAGETFTCHATPNGNGTKWIAVGLAVLGAAELMRRRRRR